MPDKGTGIGALGYYVLYRRMSDFRKLGPSQAWVIIDAHPDTMYGSSFAFLPMTNSPVWGPLPAGYHLGGCTLVFGDGHAERKKWLVPRTLLPVAYVAPMDTTVGPDRRGYDWLCACTAEYHD